MSSLSPVTILARKMKDVDGTICKLETIIMEKIYYQIEQLSHMWNEVGIFENSLEDKCHMIADQVMTFMEDLVEDEENLIRGLKAGTDTLILKIISLSQDLDISFDEPDERMTILEKKRVLTKLHAHLEEEKSARIKIWTELQKEIKESNRLMKAPDLELKSSTIIPCSSDVEVLHMQADDVKWELHKRKKQMHELKQTIKRLVGELDHKVDQQDRIYLSDEVGDLLYSNENLKLHKTFVAKLEKIKKLNLSKIASYKEELKKPFEFKLEGEGTFREEDFGYFCPASGDLVKALKEQVLTRKRTIESTIRSKQTELRQLWEKCQASCGHKEEKKDLLNGDLDKVDCSALKEELLAMESYYNNNKEILDLHKTFRDTFNDLSEAERKCIQLTKYLKATGSSRDEKHKHKLSKEVFKIQEKLTSKVSEWEEKRGAKFLFGGVDLVEYFEQAHKHLKTNKEAWKMEVKGKQLESLPPVPSSTPFKRKIANITPSKIAAKFLKLDGGTPVPVRQNVRTPLSARRIVDNQSDDSCKSSRKSNEKPEFHRQNSARNLKVTPRRSGGSGESRQLRTVRRSGQALNLPSGRRSKGSTNSSSNSLEKNNKDKAKEVDETKENFINETASYEDFSRGLVGSDKSFISSSVIVLPKPKNLSEQKFFEPIKF